jgi:cellobiose phosphorylase
MAYELLCAQNPINHADTKEKARRYAAEPYVLAADVYSAGENAGRGGWSWYTGAASWYYVVAMEDLFGINIKGDTLTFSPHLPSSWDKAAVTLRLRGARYLIEYKNEGNGGPVSVTLDGESVSDGVIRLCGDKKFHKAVVRV